MRTVEWPLVIFTVLVQMAVGLFLTFVVSLLFISGNAAEVLLDDLSLINLLVIVLLLIIGALAGTFHLGRPTNAHLAMTNLKKSWLSREMLLGLSFGLIALTLGMLCWLEIPAPIVRKLLLISGSIAAIALLYAISRIYMLCTVPTWNSILIPASFFSTSFLLGSVLFGITMAIHSPSLFTSDSLSTEAGKILVGISTGSLVLMFVQILFSYATLKGIPSQMHSMMSGFGVSRVKYRLLFMLRLGFGLIGVALYASFMDQIIGGIRIDTTWIYLLFVPLIMIFLSEISGRILFYASYKSAGI